MKKIYKISGVLLFFIMFNVGIVFGANLPSSYDLRNYIDIDVKNQSPFGICYSYGMLTSIETNLALRKNEYVDLSEIHFAIMSGQGEGGYYETENDDYFKNNIGPVYEEDCSYTNFLYNYNNGDELDKYIGDWMVKEDEENPIDQEKLKEYQNRLSGNKPAYKVTKTISFPNIYKEGYEISTEEEIQKTRKSVKEHITKYGSVWAYVSMDQYSIKNDYMVMNYNGEVQAPHVVSIVGWDDNFSKENFPDESKPKNNGAYLVLNSWGEDWGNNGYFWVSYEDRWIETKLWGVISVEELYDNIKTDSFTVKNEEDGSSIKNANIKYGQKAEINIDLSISKIIEDADIEVQIRNSKGVYTDYAEISKSSINNNKANITINLDTTKVNIGTYIIDILYGDNKISKSIRVVENTFRYIINEDNTITIKGYTGKESNIEIPKEFMGHEVSSIGDYAFYANKLLEITMYENIKSIGNDIVRGSVIIKGEKDSKAEEYAKQKDYIFLEIGKDIVENRNWSYNLVNRKLILKNNNAFYEDKYKWSTLKEYINEVEMLNEVTEIPDEAFSDMERIKKVYLSDNVTKIGNKAFTNCYQLQRISLSDNIEYIGDYAFSNCIMLDDIHLSNKLTTINEGMLLGSYRIKEIVIPDGVTKISQYAFMYCGSLKKVVIPDSVNEIGESAFQECMELTEINIPNNIKKIENYTFADCRKISKINIPEGVNFIGNYSFVNCFKLDSIIIPDTTENIGEGAFNSCSNMQFVIIPENIRNIATLTFSGCSNIKAIIYKGENLCIGENAVDNFVNMFLIKKDARVTTDYNNINFIDNLLEIKYKDLDYINVNKTIDYLTTKYIIDGEEKNITDNKIFIGNLKDDENMTINVYLEGVNTPIQIVQSTIKELKYNAFEYIVNEDGSSITLTLYYGPSKYELQEEYFGYKLTSIGEYAFSYNNELLEIKLPKTIKSIGDGAFYFNKNLKNIYIPESVVTISNDAFKECNSLEKIEVSENNLSYCSDEEGILYNKDKSVLLKYPNGNNKKCLKLNSNVKEIASWAIENKNLKELICTQNLQKINSYAIKGHTNLEKMFIYKETMTIEEGSILVDNNNFILYCEIDSVALKYAQDYNYIVKTEWDKENPEGKPEEAPETPENPEVDPEEPKEPEEKPEEKPEENPEEKQNESSQTAEQIEYINSCIEDQKRKTKLQPIVEKDLYEKNIKDDVQFSEEDSVNKNDIERQNESDINISKNEVDKKDTNINSNNIEWNIFKYVIIIISIIIIIGILFFFRNINKR